MITSGPIAPPRTNAAQTTNEGKNPHPENHLGRALIASKPRSPPRLGGCNPIHGCIVKAGDEICEKGHRLCNAHEGRDTRQAASRSLSGGHFETGRVGILLTKSPSKPEQWTSRYGVRRPRYAISPSSRTLVRLR
jgi:hypothetical protein